MAKIRKLTPSGLGGSSLTAASSRATTRAIPASLPSLVTAIFLMAASPPMLHGAFVDGIDVISQSYQISAGWSEYSQSPRPGYPNVNGGYNLSSSDGTPVAASSSSPDGLQTANASIDQFSLYNSAYAHDSMHYSNVGVGTSARGVWDFHPVDALLQLNLAITAWYGYYAPPGGSLTVELTDMTTSTTLLDLASPKGPAYPFDDAFSESDTFTVNPSDAYEFSIYAHGASHDEDGTLEDVTASIKSAPTTADFPDGGLTIGMLGMAVGGLALMRRKL